MDEIKNKFLGFINKQNNMRIPAMGFSEYFLQSVQNNSQITSPTKNDNKNENNFEQHKLSDQEILESTEQIYFEKDAKTDVYELNKFGDGETADQDLDNDSIQNSITVLKQQHKVISKKVLQLILEQRNNCNEEFQNIGETEKLLEQSLCICRSSRSYLNFAKVKLTTTSLEILATYKKREILMDLLKTLTLIKNIKSTEVNLQKLLAEGKFDSAITILLEYKTSASKHYQYKCVEALSQKLQDTLLLTELQLDDVLNEMTQRFDTDKYSKLQEAYKLLGKSIIVIDQLHMNFISAIHTTAFNVLSNNIENNGSDDKQKLFEQMCENISPDKYISCLISLCKSFWCILVSYYQVLTWHQNVNLFESHENENNEYIQQKLKKGQFRIWNDMQLKICFYINSSKIHQLKFEQYLQVLSIIQRLQKVGLEFCNELSTKLLDTIKTQSILYHKNYHVACLEEIILFLDNEAWVPVNAFTNLVQLQEFRSVKRALRRHNITVENTTTELQLQPRQSNNNQKKSKINTDNDSSINSQDDSSIYGLCGYFFRFNEKSSPFDGGFDEQMLEEDILSGIADEASCYYSEESDDDESKYDSPNGVKETNSNIIVSSSSLTVLRCIGRYLQICRLLHSIAPIIVISMTELIDFYIYSVHEIFAKDLPVPVDNLYSNLLQFNLRKIQTNILPKLKHNPIVNLMIQSDLSDADQLYGLSKRIVGVESCICLIQQYEQLKGYLNYLTNSDCYLENYLLEVQEYVGDMRKPVYISVTSRIVDIQHLLLTMSKVKWDINHVTVQHSSYIENINRSVQMFAMRLEEVALTLSIPKESIWNSFAHVLTHVLVEGFSLAKKCSTGGRALMQLDFTHFMSIFELICGQKFQQHQQYVEVYVKAYYFPKDLLEEWIKEQMKKKIYSIKHLNGLIQCTCVNDKKTKQKLMALIEFNNSNENNS